MGGDTGDRHQPDVHAEVYEGLGEDHRADAGRHHLAEGILRRLHDVRCAPEQDGEREEERQRADEAEHPHRMREDEVGRPDAQEIELALGASREAMAEPASGADGDLVLDDVETSA